MVARTALLEDGTLAEADGIRGRNTSITPGNISDYATDVMLSQAGLARADIVEGPPVDQATSIEALNSGTLDFIVITEPWVTRARKAGAADVWIPVSDLFPEFSVAALLYGPSMFELEPEVGGRFMAAYLKAVEQYNEGKTERNVEIIANFTQLTPDEVKEVCWPSFRADGKIDTDTLLQFENWANEKGYIDAVLPIEQIWDPQFVDAAHEFRMK
jgi:NitT/TauT family transport system substrate-binding protein